MKKIISDSKPNLKAFKNLLIQPKNIILILLFITTNLCYGQVSKRKNYFPVYTFHKDSINIHGISIGLWNFNENPRYTNTNGIKFALIGSGILFFMIPRSPIVESDSEFVKLASEPLSEKINGLNMATTGDFCDCKINGVSVGLIGQINFQVNGVSSSIFMNFSQKHNGMMMAMLNEAYYLKGLQLGAVNKSQKTKGVQLGIRNENTEIKGLQIGIVNKSKKMKGIQIGIWNVNEKRKLPFINWNF